MSNRESIVITGGTGFIGSHLTELMVKEGYKVTVFDRYNPNNDWGWLEQSECKNDCNIILGDIRDYDSVHKALAGCDAALHLAALIGIPYSYISPLAYIRTNIEGTYNVLEAAKAYDLDQVLITSTSEVYGSAQYSPIDESHPLVGQSPYSATKISADQLTISYWRSFNLPVKIVRPFNTYGPRQSARAIIPTIISQLLSGKDEVSLGNLSPTRDLTFVKDTCAGFHEIYMGTSFFGGATNIGMNNQISIGDLASLIADLMGKNISITHSSQRARGIQTEVDQLICDNSRLLTASMWRPEYSLTNGLQETIDWINKGENLSRYKEERYNV